MWRLLISIEKPRPEVLGAKEVFPLGYMMNEGRAIRQVTAGTHCCLAFPLHVFFLAAIIKNGTFLNICSVSGANVGLLYP